MLSATVLATRSATLAATRSAIEPASWATCTLTCDMTRAATFSLSSLTVGGAEAVAVAFSAGCGGARVAEPVMLTAGRVDPGGAAVGGLGAGSEGAGGMEPWGGGWDHLVGRNPP